MCGCSMKGMWKRVSWGAALKGCAIEFVKFGDGVLGGCIGMGSEAGV